MFFLKKNLTHYLTFQQKVNQILHRVLVHVIHESSTLNDSGIFGSGRLSPLTIAS